MPQTITCNVCGGEIAAGTSFCKFCGSPVESITIEEVVSVPASASSSCPHCGAPLRNPGQKFCISCGGALGGGSVPASSSPAMAVGGAASAGFVGARSDSVPQTPMAQQNMSQASLSADAMKERFSKASAKFDSFMGASLDLDEVGKGFDANSISASDINKAQLVRAFSFFGKSYDAPAVPESAGPLDATGEPTQRRATEAAEDQEARSKEMRDFGAKSGTTVVGALSSQLHAEFAPKVEQIAELRGTAATKEQKDRLKHKVALGDMDKLDAVEQAEG